MNTVKVGIANVGENIYPVDIVEKWTPTDIVYAGDTIFFKHDNKYYSMNSMDFHKIFNL
jgi:hypothetical protein